MPEFVMLPVSMAPPTVALSEICASKRQDARFCPNRIDASRGRRSQATMEFKSTDAAPIQQSAGGHARCSVDSERRGVQHRNYCREGTPACIVRSAFVWSSPHMEALMRKFLVMIIALATLSFLTGVASAGTVQIGGTHSESEIKSTCEKNGGTPTQNGNIYGCLNTCGNDFCSVACIGGKCLGTCPKCGERRLPVYGGKDAVNGVVTNTVQRRRLSR